MRRQFLNTIAAIALLLTSLVAVSCDSKNSDVKDEKDPVENNILSGSISGKRTLKADVEYKLDGPLIVEEGGELTIPAGTVIKASKGFSRHILVLQGGKIFINGTASAPVRMTADVENAEQGYWGGLIINGRAPLTKDPSGKYQTGSTEINSAYIYGGTDPMDNSGSITYLILEYTGARSSADVEHNGLTLNGVGAGTKIENLYIPNGADDGIEFFGGSVNVKNLLVVNSDDDMFDFTQGYNGTLENCYGIWEKGFNSTESDPRGIEADGNLDGSFADHTEQSDFTVKNMTIDLRLAPVAKDAATFKAESMHDVIKIRRGAKANIINAVVKGVGTVQDLVDCTDKKGDAAEGTVVSLTSELSTPITGKESKPGQNNATIKIEKGNTGCPTSIFAWTGYKF